MDVEEGEAKMCRLCGQYEKIYIGVFEEEGVRRYLGTKIHKINILIDEKDPLPKAICVQCLGKLECSNSFATSKRSVGAPNRCYAISTIYHR